MFTNFAIIVISLVTLVVIGVLFNFLFTKVIIPISDFISKKIASLIESEKTITIGEVIYVLMCFVYVVLFTKNGVRPLLFTFFAFSVLFVSNTIYWIRQKFPEHKSLFIRIKEYLNVQNKVVRIFLHLAEQSLYSFFVLIPVLVSFVFLTGLKWPIKVYYLGLVFLPFYTVIWVYIRKNIKFNDISVIRARRILVFILAFGYALYDLYVKFNSLLDPKTELVTFENIFMYAAVVIFLGLDRIFKELYDLGKDFEK